ncbi:hypothetical protein CPB84DRAFT_1390511 [Gymnopilus junonius]|uniref:Uncharacterized protein n=1 Tax=Gymnopilus junonius TaxID=109634 RepID=A0A9P5TK48_GYMJU|nr:hypothetical protein CPB84DRAFT_1390511 [Gymnopilus junonius]
MSFATSFLNRAIRLAVTRQPARQCTSSWSLGPSLKRLQSSRVCLHLVTMASETCSSKLHHLLDNAFTSSASLSGWLRPGNEIHLARLCVILNLEAAERALHIATSTFERSFPRSTQAESSASPLHGFRRGQENAKGILDTLKYVRASLEKGVMLASYAANIPRSDISALELFQSYISDCIKFWMSEHGIYDGLKSFLFFQRSSNFMILIQSSLPQTLTPNRR